MNRKHGCVWYFVVQKITKPLVQHVAKNITLIKKTFREIIVGQFLGIILLDDKRKSAPMR